MNEKERLWQGVNASARKALRQRDYAEGDLAQRLSSRGVNAAELVSLDRVAADVRKVWIPGVEIFARTIHPQRHRGLFGEFARRDEGLLAEIKLWPVQWSSARLFAQTGKGFHVHPPHVPSGMTAADWMKKLFVDEADDYSLREYDREQWDVMFFVQGVVEMILRDVREGLPRRTMRLFIDGDDRITASNVGVVVPPGVAHAIRAEGSQDAIMVYGTSTAFRPEFEGRIASEIESADLPAEWQQFLSS